MITRLTRLLGSRGRWPETVFAGNSVARRYPWSPMPLFDLPLEELQHHRIASAAPPDLDQFWQRALARAEELAREPVFEPYRSDIYGELAVDDVAFSGADGDRSAAGSCARRSHEPLPCLVDFVGYGGGRDFPSDHASTPVGYAVFVMDTRGQGGRWSRGNRQIQCRHVRSGAPGCDDTRHRRPGDVLLPSPLRRCRTSSRSRGAHPGVDADRIAVGGGSQGGALALAAAALAPGRVRLCHADMPFLCDIERAVMMGLEHPYSSSRRISPNPVSRSRV